MVKESLTVRFIEQPESQRSGGLGIAVSGLRNALQRLGVIVSTHEGRIVHFHGAWQPSFAWQSFSFRRKGIPYVASPHGALEPWALKHKKWKKGPYFALFERGYLAGADCLLATGVGEAKQLKRLFPHSRIETLPLGLTSDSRPDYHRARDVLGWKNHEIILLFLSRIHPKKGLDLLLESLIIGASKYDDKQTNSIRLVIVGSGDIHYVRSLKQLVEEKKDHLPRIDWVGEVWGDERWKYFQGADLYCLPSHSENFGLTVLEASQVGTPVLTTNTTPWADILPTAYIADPNVSSIREVLFGFISSQKQSNGMRHELSKWTWQHYHWDVLVRQYVDLYKEIIKHT